MDSHRAQEIIDSLGVIEVRHQGASVWIEQVDNNEAEIRYLHSGRQTRVPVQELTE
ncbi:MAG: H-type small acid-soluble spore protein [Syntrophomonadaceae bacterium]|nr:H-type small acid-soluble spore protein [Syntrophomonadaceae bacterium]